MTVESTIFKAYDIRGIYPEQLNEEVAYAVARAYATLMTKENQGRQLKIAVSGDMRASTPTLKKEVIRGLTDCGINIVDLGMESSPTYYFATGFWKFDGGIQITASHNAAEYNGLKLVRAQGVAMGGHTGIYDIHEIVKADAFLPVAENKGSVETQEGVTVTTINEFFKLAPADGIKPMKIVIDPANAMGITDFGLLFDHLPQIDLVKMNFELDGTFPNHEADPLKPENTADIRAKVVELGADLGITTDGDADRIFIIDEKGDTIPSPILYTMLAHIEHEENPGDALAYEIRLGNLIPDEFPDVKLIQTPVGHSLIKAEMVKHNALFGGEISGHYFFRLPWGTYEAPALLALKFMNWFSKQDKPLSELVAYYRRYTSSGEINTKVGTRDEVEAVITTIKEKYNDGEQVTIDGVKVSYSDYWFSVRASNTEPLIRLIVEAKDPSLMEAKRDEILAIIRA